MAFKNYNDNQLIFRLTADNVLPCGELLNEIESFFRSKNLDYIHTTDIRSGLPFGLSAELTLLKYLREANKNTESSYDREHVTPYIKKKYSVNVFDKYSKLKMSKYRCTVDVHDDYKRIFELFKKANILIT